MSNDSSIKSIPQLEMNILVDGWDLIYHPLSASAIHSLELLAAIPHHFPTYLALPQPAPDWLSRLPNLSIISHISANTPKNRLFWQELIIPRIAHQSRASHIHLTHPITPLFAEGTVIFSPAQVDLFSRYQRHSSIWERLTYAMAQGGYHRVQKILFPNDLPHPFENNIPFDKIRTITPPPALSLQVFSSDNSFSIPSQPYLLYIGNADSNSLISLLNAWKKTCAALGDQMTLCLIPGNDEQKSFLDQSHFSTLPNLVHISPQNPIEVISLIQHAYAFIQLTPEPYWGGFARQALLAGIPLIGFETPSLSQMVQSAGYLVESNADRLLSAAMITLTVEEEVYQALKNKAELRKALYQNSAFSAQIEQIYQETG